MERVDAEFETHPQGGQHPASRASRVVRLRPAAIAHPLVRLDRERAAMEVLLQYSKKRREFGEHCAFEDFPAQMLESAAFT